MPDTLAQKIKAKYPGQYDHLSDQELEAKVTAKYPGVYDAVPKTAPEKGAQVAAPMNRATVNGQPMPVEDERGWGDTVSDVAIGAAKGVGNTVYGLGKLAHDYTPIGRISDAIQPGAFDPANKPPELTPANTPQKVGQGLEQVAEFFVPAGAPAKLARAAEVAKAGFLTMAQTGSPATAGVSAALTAALPGGNVAGKAAGALEEGARKEMAQALGATKEWAKAEAAKLAPQMLKRGIGGSREAMLANAQATAARVGGELNNAYAAASAAGHTVPSNIIAGNVQLARDALQTTLPSGARVTIPGTEPIVAKLDELADFVLKLGPDIPVDKAAHVKRTWDQIVSKAGLFGPKATSSATDSANAWAIREASNSFRQLLNSNPTIAALNAESAFWTGLKGVLKETQKRTQAQAGTGLVQAGMGGTGAVIGAMSGDSMQEKALNGAIGALAGRQFVKLVQSPAFRTQVSGPAKQLLADALASGSAGRITAAVQQAIKAMPAQLQPAFAQ